ncbi:MAG TPA: FAD-dependent oxidoreductase, partial [bacterium]|nr:FAD-dependent oxidoreductase [bacterium]
MGVEQEIEIACDVLVVGAGLGGCAAALRAVRLGRRVCLIEETGWPGGQISTQGVSSLDEHRYIETFGGTGSYYALREAIRSYYRSQYALTSAAAAAPQLNPGNAWVSRLSFEPRAGAAVLEAMMAGPHETGELQVFYHTRAVAAEVYDGQVASVLTRHRENGTFIRFRAAFVLDATDLGDVLVYTATAYALGQESRAETGEPSAPDVPNPACLQNFTFPIAVEYCPGEDHTIPKPEGYEQNRDAQPYTFVYRPWLTGTPPYKMFATAQGTGGPFWTYRRALDARNFNDPRVPRDVSILNWTGNDFRGGTVVDRAADEQATRYRQARLLSLGFLYWLQTEAPRDEGGTGYPELRLRPDVMGSADGLSQVPYVREGRRLRARSTIVERDIAAHAHPESRAARFDDAVGIAFYPIDLHGCGDRTTDIDTKPFQIPLGALVPARTSNLLPAAKNIGTTHITNGAYRLHPA